MKKNGNDHKNAKPKQIYSIFPFFISENPLDIETPVQDVEEGEDEKPKDDHVDDEEDKKKEEEEEEDGADGNDMEGVEEGKEEEIAQEPKPDEDKTDVRPLNQY